MYTHTITVKGTRAICQELKQLSKALPRLNFSSTLNRISLGEVEYIQHDPLLLQQFVLRLQNVTPAIFPYIAEEHPTISWPAVGFNQQLVWHWYTCLPDQWDCRTDSNMHTWQFITSLWRRARHAACDTTCCEYNVAEFSDRDVVLLDDNCVMRCIGRSFPGLSQAPCGSFSKVRQGCQS